MQGFCRLRDVPSEGFFRIEAHRETTFVVVSVTAFLVETAMWVDAGSEALIKASKVLMDERILMDAVTFTSS